MTREQARERLAEFVLGTLDEGDAQAVQVWLTRDDSLAREADHWAHVLGGLSEELEEAPPPPVLRTRLLADVARDRFYPYAQKIAKFCDITKERMREVLRFIDDPEKWEEVPMFGIAVIHFEHGPKSLGTDTGILRLPAGMVWPKHEHHGLETNFILQGELFDNGEKRYGPGEYVQKQEGDEHHFTVGKDSDLLMIVIHNGFDITGMPDS